jgi:pimeloyl-ACP methyl ester carboxylesterase
MSYKLTSLLGALVLSALISGCGDSTPERGQLVEQSPSITTVAAAVIDQSSTSAGIQPIIGANAQCGVEVVPLHYYTSGVRGELTTASGVMLVPRGTSAICKGPFPLVSYTRGTDIDKTRTLANPADTETGAVAAFFAAHGAVVVATDYLGYGKSAYAFHPYLHAASQATSVIDAMRAARRISSAQSIPLSGKVFLYGYSQGGHASMSAHRAIENSSELSAEFKIAGAAHGAAPAALRTAVSQNPPSITVSGQFFVPFFVTAWQKIYGGIYAAASDVFNAPYAADIESLFPSAKYTFTTAITNGKIPGTAPPTWFTDLFTASFRGGFSTNGPLLAAAADNDFHGSSWTPVAPTMLCMGSNDPTVPYALGQALMKTKWANLITMGRVFEVDVDPTVQSTMVPAACPQADPLEKQTCIATKYHGTLAPPLCLKAVKDFFAQLPAN